MDRKSKNEKRIMLVLLALAGALLAQQKTPPQNLPPTQNMQRGPVRSPHGSMNIACANCHTSINWQPLRAALEFDHNRETAYPLKGMHATVACRQCHANMIFKEASTRCADCHADLHRRQLGAKCEDCHSVKGWALKTQAVRE